MGIQWHEETSQYRYWCPKCELWIELGTDDISIASLTARQHRMYVG